MKDKQNQQTLSLAGLLQKEENGRLLFSIRERFQIAEGIEDALRRIHSEGKLYLALTPDNVTVNFRTQDTSLLEICDVNLRPSGQLFVPGQTADIPFYEGYSAPECRLSRRSLRSRRNTDSANKAKNAGGVGIPSDIYMFGTVLKTIFYASKDAEGFGTAEKAEKSQGNVVFRALMKNLIDGCLMKEPWNRFGDDETVLEGLQYGKLALNYYSRADYLSLADLAYHCSLPTQDCALRPAAANFDKESFHTAVQTLLQERLLTENVDRYHTLYAYEILQDMADHYAAQISTDDRTMLILCGMRCYNRFGDSGRVQQLGRELRHLPETSPMVLDANLLLAVAQTDTGNYEAALKLANFNIRYLERLKMEKPGTAGEDAADRENRGNRENREEWLQKLGRSYSSRGCSMARLQKEGVLDAFQRAIQCFSSEQNLRSKEGNIRITTCHILHYACQCHDQKLYEQYAERYFLGKDGTRDISESNISTDNIRKDNTSEADISKDNISGNDTGENRNNGSAAEQKDHDGGAVPVYLAASDVLMDRLRQQFKENQARDYYPMYAYLKGLYTFYLNAPEMPDVYARLREFSSLPFTGEDRVYPLSLVFLYLGLIAFRCGDNVLDSLDSIDGSRVNSKEEQADDDMQTCFRQALACDSDVRDCPWNMQMVILTRIQWIYNELTGRQTQNQQLLSWLLYALHEAGWKEMEQRLLRNRDVEGLLCFEEA